MPLTDRNVDEVTSIRNPHTPEQILNQLSREELEHYDAAVDSLVRSVTTRVPRTGGRVSRPIAPPSFKTAATSSKHESAKLMALGRQELLMREAEVQKKIVIRANNKDRVGLTSIELSHLHQQLQGINTTCTLIIGFAMASLSADLLGALGDDASLFCIYKSIPSAILSGAFVILTTTCICACFTIIACVQIIIFQSQRAIFSRSMTHRVDDAFSSRGKRINLTSLVVRMTQLLIYGDRSALWDKRRAEPGDATRPAGLGRIPSLRSLHAPSARRKGRGPWSAGSQRREALAVEGFTIYIGLSVALSCFFFSTLILIWIFLSPLASWRYLTPSNASLVGRAAVDGLVQTSDGRWKTRCLDPTNDDDAAYMVLIGTIVSVLSTLVFLANIITGYRVAVHTMRRYSLPSLLALAEEDEDEPPVGSMRGADGEPAEQVQQDFEDYVEESFHHDDTRHRDRLSVHLHA